MRNLAVASTLACLSAFAGEPSKSAFGPGEQSVFSVSYLGVPTGTAVITVGLQMEQFGKPIWPIVCTATTDLSIYPVRDRYISYWDWESNKNIGSEFTVEENHHKRREKMKYDPPKKKIYATKQEESQKPREIVYDAPDGTVDLAGAAFSLRNAPLEQGEEHHVPVFTGLITYQMIAKVAGKETLKTILGEKSCLKVSFTADWTGGLAAKRALTLWVLDDPSHLPVKFEAELMVGSVVAELSTFYPGRDFTR